MLAIVFLEDVIAGRGDAAAPLVLLHVRRTSLCAPSRTTRTVWSPEQVQIAEAVDMVMAKLPDIRTTRNRASRTAKHRELACSLVAKALGNVGRAMSEDNVQVAWERYGVCRELIRRNSFSAN